MKITQPFGKNDAGIDYTAAFGMKGHNGWDLSARTGTEVLAVCDGDMSVMNGGTGYGNEIRIVHWLDAVSGLEIVYGHLDRFEGDSRKVKAGELIGYTDNTGFRTGPHLHLGVRRIIKTKDGYMVHQYSNGYYGYIDPSPFFEDSATKLPVDTKYGGLTLPSIGEFAQHYLYFIRSQKRLPTPTEYNGLRYGRWDLRTVLDPLMFEVWSKHTKPEAKNLGLIK